MAEVAYPSSESGKLNTLKFVNWKNKTKKTSYGEKCSESVNHLGSKHYCNTDAVNIGLARLCLMIVFSKMSLLT